jgi:hypothetical protein
MLKPLTIRNHLERVAYQPGALWVKNQVPCAVHLRIQIAKGSYLSHAEFGPTQ